MNATHLVTVLPIVAICYFAGIGAKAFKVNKKFIPLITGGLGGILGVVGFFTMSDFPAHDLVTSIAIGIISGLASTGFNETLKNLTKRDNEKQNTLKNVKNDTKQG